MTGVATLMLNALFSALNSILGKAANNLLSQVLAYYVNFDFRSMFTVQFLKAYGYVWGFGILLTIVGALAGIIVELFNGKGRFHQLGKSAAKALLWSPVIPFTSYIVFGLLGTLVKLIVATSSAMGASVTGLNGTGSALSLPAAAILVMQLTSVWAILSLTILSGPILLSALVTGDWGSRFMRGIYVVVMTAILTQPAALVVLVLGFFVVKIEGAFGLPSVITSTTPVVFFLLAGLGAPLALLYFGVVRYVNVVGGDLDTSGTGESTLSALPGSSPLRSIIEGSLSVTGSSMVPFAGQLAGNADAGDSGMNMPSARNLVAGLLEHGGAEAAATAFGQAWAIPIIHKVAPVLAGAIGEDQPADTADDAVVTLPSSDYSVQPPAAPESEPAMASAASAASPTPRAIEPAPTEGGD